MAESEFDHARGIILKQLESVKTNLSKLPLTPETINRYAQRLEANVALRIYKARILPNCCQKERQTVGQALLTSGRDAINYLQPYLRRPSYYLVSAAGLIIPLAAEYVHRGFRTEVYSWMAAFTAVLALLGLGRIGKKAWKNRKVKRRLRKVEKRIRRMIRFQNLKKFLLKRPCLEDCAAVCCEPCCQSFCEFACDEICYWINNRACEVCGDAAREGKMWPWLVLSLLAIGIGTLIVFVLVF